MTKPAPQHLIDLAKQELERSADRIQEHMRALKEETQKCNELREWIDAQSVRLMGIYPEGAHPMSHVARDWIKSQAIANTTASKS